MRPGMIGIPGRHDASLSMTVRPGMSGSPRSAMRACLAPRGRPRSVRKITVTPCRHPNARQSSQITGLRQVAVRSPSLDLTAWGRAPMSEGVAVVRTAILVLREAAHLRTVASALIPAAIAVAGLLPPVSLQAYIEARHSSWRRAGLGKVTPRLKRGAASHSP